MTKTLGINRCVVRRKGRTLLIVVLVALAIALGIDRNGPGVVASAGRVELEPATLRSCERAMVLSNHELGGSTTPLDVVIVLDLSMRKKNWEDGVKHIERIATSVPISAAS